MKRIIKCKDCGKEIEVAPRARYERKYCPKCSKERKAAYENLHEIEFEDCDD